MRIKGRARALTRLAGGIAVETDHHRIPSKRVLMCIGQTEASCWPDWSIRAREDGAAIYHVFDPDFNPAAPSPRERTVVVGGGLTAVQTALYRARTAPTPVVLLSPHGLRKSNFDFDPCWIGPKCMRGFLSAGLEERRKLIDTARLPGTLPLEVHGQAAAAIRDGRLRFQRGQVEAVRISNGSLLLSLDAGDIETDQIILATGFHPGRPAH